MEIKIGSKVVHYIKAKGGVVHLVFSTQGGGCCGGSGLLIPDIFFGIPKGDINNYQELDVNGVKIYVSKDVPENSQLMLGLDSLFIFKKLTVEGLEPKDKNHCK